MFCIVYHMKYEFASHKAGGRKVQSPPTTVSLRRHNSLELMKKNKKKQTNKNSHTAVISEAPICETHICTYQAH